MKFKTNHTRFFKEWTAGEFRILRDVYANVFLPYEVQKREGGRWVKVRSFLKLAEAKEAVAWMAEDAAMDASRMA